MNVIGREILHFQSLASTNDFLKIKAEAGAEEGLVISADEQTRGRGRADRTWFSARGLGLYFSVLLRPRIENRFGGILSLMPAIAVANAISDACGVAPGLKWPNDVYLSDKKVAGILVEAKSVHRDLLYVIVGIGVNVLQEAHDFPPELRSTAGSIRSATGLRMSRDRLFRTILTRLDSLYSVVRNQANWRRVIRNNWLKLCAHHHGRVHVHNGHLAVEGIFDGITELGEALIRTEDGGVETLTLGEFTLRKSENATDY